MDTNKQLVVWFLRAIGILGAILLALAYTWGR